MKVLLDEMLPAGVIGLLPGHEVTTVRRRGSRGSRTASCSGRAAAIGYAVLLTADRSLPAQQNVTVSGIAVVLVRGSRMSEVADQAMQIQAAVSAAQPGTVTRVEPV